jgi:hypothetical protein
VPTPPRLPWQQTAAREVQMSLRRFGPIRLTIAMEAAVQQTVGQPLVGRSLVPTIVVTSSVDQLCRGALFAFAMGRSTTRCSVKRVSSHVHRPERGVEQRIAEQDG